jgi:hypothetical protein
MTHALRCGRFWLWALAGGLLTFSVVGAASIGLFVLPLALAAIWFAFRAGRVWPEALGTLAGAAAVCFLIGYLQSEPGGFDSLPWFVAGCVLAPTGMVGYALLARRISRPA